MAWEYFTHLGIAILNPGGRKSGTGTSCSVSEIVDKGADELQRLFAAEESMLFRRDRSLCPVSASPFHPEDPDGYRANMAHVIPNSLYGKPDTLKCIAMFAGEKTRDEVMSHLNGIGNGMNLKSNAHWRYGILDWGIKARDEEGRVKYIYQRVPFSPARGPKPIHLKDGDEIIFGAGSDGARLGGGLLPRLCNLRLAVARVLKMSGAADIILEWQNEADDGGIPHLFIGSEHFCNILDAQLLLSGQALPEL